MTEVRDPFNIVLAIDGKGQPVTPTFEFIEFLEDLRRAALSVRAISSSTGEAIPLTSPSGARLRSVGPSGVEPVGGGRRSVRGAAAPIGRGSSKLNTGPL